jgi:hypothetical protein
MYIAIILAAGVVHAVLWVGFYALRIHGVSFFRDHGWFEFGGPDLTVVVPDIGLGKGHPHRMRVELKRPDGSREMLEGVASIPFEDGPNVTRRQLHTFRFQAPKDTDSARHRDLDDGRIARASAGEVPGHDHAPVRTRNGEVSPRRREADPQPLVLIQALEVEPRGAVQESMYSGSDRPPKDKPRARP